MNSENKAAVDKVLEPTPDAKKPEKQEPDINKQAKKTEKVGEIEIAHQPGTQEHYLGGDYSSNFFNNIR